MSGYPIIIPPGGSRTVTVGFAPSTPGMKSAQLRIASNAPSSPHTRALMGTLETEPAPPTTLQRLYTSGTTIRSADGAVVILKSTNWHGAEGENYIPHGLWTSTGRSYRSILDQIKGWGFNCIRLPFSGTWATVGNTLTPTSAFDAALNPEFVGKTVFECIDLILDYCEEIGLYVVLDHHRRSQGAGADGSPVGGGYTAASWQATWTMLATRWADRVCIAGADLHNEPHDLTWGAWADLVEPCANAIHAIAPDWLIFVEGVGTHGGVTYWWGGQLAGVATRPVALTQPNRVVYSPHEYGQSVSLQSWLQRPGFTVAGWPGSLNAVWEPVFGFILTNGIAPLWFGEFGGWFGIDGAGAATKPYATEEIQWLDTFSDWILARGASWAFWTYPPLSADTGGLLLDDWTTAAAHKLTLLAPLLGVTVPPTGEEMLTEDGTPLLAEDGATLEV